MERTEEPTKKKLQDAKKKGQAPFSQDLANSLLLTVFFASLSFFSEPLLKRFETLFHFKSDLKSAFSPLIIPLLCLFCILMLVSFFSHVLQKGWIFTAKKGPKIKERPFFYHFIMLIAKMALLAILTVVFMKKNLFFMDGRDLIYSLLRFATAVSLSFFLLALFDFFYGIQVWKKAMRMTKEEVKEEKRQSDGDSQIKDRLRKR